MTHEEIQKLRLDHATLRGAMTAILDQLASMECDNHDGMICVMIRIGEAALEGKSVGS